MRKIVLLLSAALYSSIAFAQWTTSGNNINNTNSGNVGIGTTTPGSSLHVKSSTPILSTGPGAGFRLRDLSLTTSANDWTWYSKNGFLYLLKGDAGATPLGSLHPGNRFQINPNGSFNMYGGLIVTGQIYGADTLKLNAHEGESVSGTANIVSYGGGANINLQFGTRSNGQQINVMRLASNGNVGIGTITPEAPLHVISTVLSTGTGSGFKFRDWKTGAVPGVDDWHLYATNGSARLHKVMVGDLFTMTETGNMGIGTTQPGSYKLAVEGKIGAREIEVKTGSWADFVFKPGYDLPSLSSIEEYIKQHNHLPNIPSEEEVKSNGIALGEMNARLLQKIEELTLYSISQQKQIAILQKEMTSLKKAVSTKRKPYNPFHLVRQSFNLHRSTCL